MRELTSKEVDMVSGAGVFSAGGGGILGGMAGYSFAKANGFGPKGTALSVGIMAASGAASGSSS